MDKLYRPLFLTELKLRVAQQLPGFTEHRVPRDHPLREVFAGALLFACSIRSEWTIWLWWVPAPGVERSFDLLLGWSSGSNVLPHPGEHDKHIYSLRGPSAEYPAAAIHLQQVEGRAAIGGFTIPTPWDQLLAVKVSAPKREHDAAMQKAHTEALALSNQQRLEAVRATLDEVFARLLAVIPAFVNESRPIKSDA